MRGLSAVGLGLALALALAVGGDAVAKGGGGHGGGHGGGGHGGGHGGHGGGHGGPHVGGRGAVHFAAPRAGRAHVSGGRHFMARRSFTPGVATSRVAPQQFSAPHIARLTPRTMRAALNANASARHAGVLHDPGLRAAIAATAATAAWHGARNANLGWWRHGNGGYGWVGPLFWPFAYYDLYDYAFWGPVYGVSFWDYGYADLYAGIFAPYGYDTLSGYLPRYASVARGRRGRTSNGGQLTQICNADGGEIAGIPAEQINATMTLTADQRSALEQLANASVKGAQAIREACPTDLALTAPARLGVMQQRIEAMLGAVAMLQPPLEDFYGSLNDEQKAQFGALIDQQRRSDSRRGVAAGPDCGMAQTGLQDWPQGEIERKVQPTEAQRGSLAALQQAVSKAADSLKTSCQPDAAITLPARVAAIKDRLTAMLQAVKSVRAALDDFYGTLSDEQKAQFESIGRARVG